jgi:hypothetical protein
MCDDFSTSSDDEAAGGIEAQFSGVRESFKRAEFRRLTGEEWDELELRRLQELKGYGRETANSVGFCFHSVRDARTQ